MICHTGKIERVEGETNWDHCLRLAGSIDKDELIRALIIKLYSMRKRDEKSHPCWSFIGEATSHGSGVSSAICELYGVNSDSGKIRYPGDKEAE